MWNLKRCKSTQPLYRVPLQSLCFFFSLSYSYYLSISLKSFNSTQSVQGFSQIFLFYFSLVVSQKDSNLLTASQEVLSLSLSVSLSVSVYLSLSKKFKSIQPRYIGPPKFFSFTHPLLWNKNFQYLPLSFRIYVYIYIYIYIFLFHRGTRRYMGLNSGNFEFPRNNHFN